MDNNFILVSLDDAFKFSCSKNVSCFNACCRDLNQSLTPYDILRLKNHLGISSTDFLERYCAQHTGPESGLPIVTLKPKEVPELTCPFVTSAGCSVYAHRPSSCRTYPLVRAISKSRETGEMTERFMLLKESHCLGFNEEKTQTVRRWIEDQGVAVYNAVNDLLMEIISLKNRLIPGLLDMKSRHLFCLALYDLDNFRTQIFEKGRLNDFDVDQDTLKRAKADDVALLKLGLKWVKRKLFNE